MKRLAWIAIILCTGLAGCQSISVPINACCGIAPEEGKMLASHGISVVIRDSNNKNVEVPTAIKGNVPLQGGSVTDSGENVAQ